MMKRVTWFVGGIAAGAAGTGYAKRRVRSTFKRRTAELTDQHQAARIAESALKGARRGALRVRDAAREGRLAMINKENELRTRRDHIIEPIDDRLEPGDQLLVDGQPVDTGRVIVLRPDGPSRRRRRSS